MNQNWRQGLGICCKKPFRLFEYMLKFEMHIVRGKWWQGSSTESTQISMLDKGIYSCYPSESKNNQQWITLPGSSSFFGRFNLSFLQEDDCGFWRKKRTEWRHCVSRGLVMFGDCKGWCFSSTEFQERKMPGDTATGMQPGGVGSWDLTSLYPRYVNLISETTEGY